MNKNKKRLLVLSIAGLFLIFPAITFAQNFNNPLAYNTVEAFLSGILAYMQGIIVVLSLVFIVIGAILYITSSGNDKRMETAKGAIFASMIGLAIGIGAPSFLREIYTVLEANNSINGTALANALPLTQIGMNVLNFLLSIIGILAIVMFVVGGMMYFFAMGDEKKTETGKNMIKYAIIGFSIALASLLIVKQIGKFFE